MARKSLSMAGLALTLMCQVLATDLAAQARSHGQSAGGGSQAGTQHAMGPGQGAAKDGPDGPPSRPEGWDKGEKVGWGNCKEPPGLGEKSGCGVRPSHRPTATGSKPKDGHADHSAPTPDNPESGKAHHHKQHSLPAKQE